MEKNQFEKEIENELSNDRGLFISDIIEKPITEDILISMFNESIKDKI